MCIRDRASPPGKIRRPPGPARVFASWAQRPHSPSFGISFDFSGSATSPLSTPLHSSVAFRGLRMLSRSPPRVGMAFPCPLEYLLLPGWRPYIRLPPQPKLPPPRSQECRKHASGPDSTIFRDLVRFLRQRHKSAFDAPTQLRSLSGPTNAFSLAAAGRKLLPVPAVNHLSGYCSISQAAPQVCFRRPYPAQSPFGAFECFLARRRG